MFALNILSCVTKLQLVICWSTISFLMHITSSFENSLQESNLQISEDHENYLSGNNEIDLLKKGCERTSFKISHDEDYSCSMLSSQCLPEFIYTENVIHEEEQDIKDSKLNVEETISWLHPFMPVSDPDSKCSEDTAHYLRDLKQFQFWAIQNYVCFLVLDTTSFGESVSPFSSAEVLWLVENGDMDLPKLVVLTTRKQISAVQLWDASGKITSGLLSGNSNQLGDFDSCIGVEIGELRGKYCLAYIDLEPMDTAVPSILAALSRIQAGSFLQSKRTDPGHFISLFSTLKWGLCVPSSCNESEVERGLKEATGMFTTFGVHADIIVQPGMCYLKQEDPTLPFATLITLGVFGGFLMLAVVATVADIRMQNIKLKVKGRAVYAFSLHKNMNNLLTKCTDELPCIHGIRSIITFILFAAHKLIPIASTPYNNRIILTQYSNYSMSSLLRSSSIYTDTFLQLSGVLASYNLSKEIARNGSIKWKTRFIARFIRLTPALLAVCLYYAYVMEYLGTGPQWTSVVTANADICKTNLWKNILYIQNFYPFEEMCASHTYQLAVDMQLYLMAPPLVYMFYHCPYSTSILLTSLVVFTAFLRYYITVGNNLSLYIYHSITVSDLYKTATMTYTNSFHRSTPYLIGIALGCFLFYKDRKLHMSKIHVILGWTVSIISALACIFYPSQMAAKGAVYNATDAALYAAVSPIIWPMALSWCIIASCTGYAGKVNNFLEHHWMIVLSRLSYGIYLTQFTVFFYYIGTLRTSQDFSLLTVIGLYEVIAVLLASLVVTLLFDFPMQDIKNLLLTQKI